MRLCLFLKYYFYILSLLMLRLQFPQKMIHLNKHVMAILIMWKKLKKLTFSYQYLQFNFFITQISLLEHRYICTIDLLYKFNFKIRIYKIKLIKFLIFMSFYTQYLVIYGNQSQNNLTYFNNIIFRNYCPFLKMFFT